MIVRCIPSSPSWLDSFYIGNLIRGLQAEGIVFDLPADESGDFLSGRWLRANTGRVGLLHFHWTHYHYTVDTWLRSATELTKFIGKIVLARRLGYKVIWTMHNYMPHERTYPLLHFVERFLLARLAHAVIVHCEHGRMLLRRKLLRSSRVFVIPLGDYSPFLPPLPARARARAQFGFANDCIVFCFFGSIRPYKQVAELIREFRTVDGANLRLMITGVPLNNALRRGVMEEAILDARVWPNLEYVSDEALATCLAAADVAVFPFRDILGSGSAMLALAAGLPIVAPRIGCLAELVTHDCGALYQPGPGQLAATLRQMIGRDLRAMSRAAQDRAKRFRWETMIKDTARVYQESLPHA